MRHLHAVLAVGILSFVAAHDAQALSFGRVRSAAVLGQTLSVAIPVVLSPGEDEITDECMRAVVTHGETTLPPNVVRVRTTRGDDESTRVVRISTTTAVDEPVVMVALNVGCPTRLSRTFTLLADPPTMLARTSPVQAPIANEERVSPRQEPAATGTAATGAGRSSPAPRRERQPRRTVTADAPPPTAASASTAEPAPKRAATAPKPRAAAEAEKPRLQLESGSVTAGAGAPVAVSGPDPAAIAAAMAAAEAAQAAIVAAEQRAKALEAEIERLKATTKEQADSIVKLQGKVVQGQQVNDWSRWLPWIAGLAALSMALAAWLSYRVRKLSIEAQRATWWVRENQSSLLQSRVTDLEREEAVLPPAVRSPAAIVTAPPPAVASDRPTSSFMPSTVNVAPETIPASVGAVLAVSSRQAARPSTMQSDMQADTHRAVTVDEQIDLEQQADFFIALGHDDAAIDLLLAHLRNTGGAAPIPYLKLLEMYRRRGDRDDYEVMRRRFNQRFNSVAPEWDNYGQAGRSLTEYPAQVDRLQAVWPNHLDTMAELEAMAFGRGNEQELFDLPAYQDVLFLYQLARQLHEESSQGRGSGVDVLLPLGGETGSAPLMTKLADAPVGATVNSTVMGGLDLDISSQRGELSAAGLSAPALRPMPLIDLDLPRRKTKS